jgi:hypothetical protein
MLPRLFGQEKRGQFFGLMVSYLFIAGFDQIT